jgi:hypothetical protein
MTLPRCTGARAGCPVADVALIAYIQFITFSTSDSAGGEDSPDASKISEANKPTPQNRTIVLRLSSSVEIAGIALDKALTIAAMAVPFV